MITFPPVTIDSYSFLDLFSVYSKEDILQRNKLSKDSRPDIEG